MLTSCIHALQCYAPTGEHRLTIDLGTFATERRVATTVATDGFLVFSAIAKTPTKGQLVVSRIAGIAAGNQPEVSAAVCPLRRLFVVPSRQPACRPCMPLRLPQRLRDVLPSPCLKLAARRHRDSAPDRSRDEPRPAQSPPKQLIALTSAAESAARLSAATLFAANTAREDLCKPFNSLWIPQVVATLDIKGLGAGLLSRCGLTGTGAITVKSNRNGIYTVYIVSRSAIGFNQSMQGTQHSALAMRSSSNGIYAVCIASSIPPR